MTDPWAIVGAVGGVSGLLAAWRIVRAVRPKARRFAHKARRLWAAMVGEDPILNPDTGVVLREAVPPLTDRLTSLDGNMSAVRSAVEKLADVRDDITHAQRTADEALELARTTAAEFHKHRADAAAHIPMQRVAEGH